MKNKKIIAAALLPSDVPGILDRSNTIKDCITGNVWVTTTVPDMITFDTHIKDATDAQAAVHNGIPGSADVRDKKIATLQKDIKHLVADVQFVADSNPHHAVEIILGAGMFVINYAGRKSQSFKVKSERSEEATFTAPVPDNTYNYCIAWFKSVDGHVWDFDNATPVAETTMFNLVSGTLMYFNYKITIGKERMGDFNNPISCRIK